MKRLVCILIVLSVLTAVLLTPAMAAAPTFADSNMIENTCAVEMLTDLGIIDGYEDGYFRPRNYITRQAAMKIITQLMTDNPRPESLSGFSDVNEISQFSHYIYYGYEQGIVSGSNGYFNPTAHITARALAKILLGALGHDTSAYSGAGWADRVDEDARAAGIYDGFYDYYDEPVTRDNACLLIFNAMQSYAIAGYNGSEPIYHLDELMNPQTLLEYRYGVVMYTELLIANEYADMTVTDGRLEDNYSQLEHHRALEVETDLQMLGRNIVLFAKDGVVLGVPTYSPYEGYYTFHDFNDFAQVLLRLNLEVNADTQFFYNFNESNRLEFVRAGENVEITIVDHTGDGLLDVVLMIEYLDATVRSVENGVLMAAFATGEPFAVVAEAEQAARFAAGDTISVSFIGGRYLLKAE